MRKRIFILSCIIFTFSCVLFAQDYYPKGNKLCDSIFYYLERNNLTPEKQEIISSPDNNFPYNIVIKFNSNKLPCDDNLVICLKMEDAYENMDLITQIAGQLYGRDFNTYIILIYGSSSTIPRRRIPNGTNVAVKNLHSSDNNIVLNVNLTSSRNTITASTMGKSSPSWMVKNTFQAYVNQHLTEDLPFYYLSQMSTYMFNFDSIIIPFSTRDIPTITANFKTNTFSKDQVFNVILEFINSYENSRNKEFDNHSIMFRIGNHDIWFTEYTIVKIILLISFLSLIFIFILSFVNSNLRNKAWLEIKNNWYSIPCTFALTIIGFYISKGIYYLANKSSPSETATAFGLILLELIIASALVSTFYFFEMAFHRTSYGERSVDFLVLITTFINQFLFSLADISLYPLFMLSCIFAIISLILKRNWGHILMFILMILVYIPYVQRFFDLASSDTLRRYLQRSNSAIFSISAILLPIYLMWFRILTALRTKITKRRYYFIICLLTFVFIFSILTVINFTAFKNTKSESRIYTSEQNINYNDIELSYTDKNVFGDTIRTIHYKTTQPANYVKISVSSKDQNPILYSEYDYTTENPTTSSFDIPYDPPSEMSFTYGTTDIPTTIFVEALYLSNAEKKEYISRKKTITIGNADGN